MAKKQQELVEQEKPKINELIIRETLRENGTLRYQLDYSNCPTMTEQHTAHLTDLNYLIKTLKPDELVAYMGQRAQYRQEILGHDFSVEPDKQSAMNTIYTLKKNYQKLMEDHPELNGLFKNHVEFLKYLDNPANQEKLLRMGVMTKEEIKANTSDGISEERSDDKAPNADKK